MSLPKNYTYLLDYYDMTYLQDRGLYWFKVASQAIKAMQLQDIAHVNFELMTHVVCCYFADIVRLKNFHPITDTNIEKITAYGVYWFVRVKPIQYNKSKIPLEKHWINEKVGALVLYADIIHKNQDKLNDNHLSLLQEWLYAFKYRTYTPQTIELALASYNVAILYGQGSINMAS